MSENYHLFVAETDDDGSIACVWVRTPGDTVARPVQHDCELVCFGPDAIVWGAPREHIYEWLVGRVGEKTL